MERNIFTKEIKIADMLHQDVKLLFVLPRFGIKLGFGDATIDQVCIKYGIDSEVFLAICNLYAFDGYTPKLQRLDQASLRSIISYLRASHMEYENETIPHIMMHIENLAGDSENRQKKIIETFIKEYKQDVSEHFAYEEMVVFPYIESLIEDKAQDKYEIKEFIDNHTNIDDKLHDLKSIIMKYVEPKSGDDRENLYLLMDIYIFEQDLKRHTIIEDKMLVALVEVMEESRR